MEHFFCNQNLTSFRRVISVDSTPTALTMSEVSTKAQTLQGLVTIFLPLLMAQTHCLGPQLRSGGGTFFYNQNLTTLRRVISADSTLTALTMSEVSTHTPKPYRDSLQLFCHYSLRRGHPLVESANEKNSIAPFF